MNPGAVVEAFKILRELTAAINAATVEMGKTRAVLESLEITAERNGDGEAYVVTAERVGDGDGR